MITTKSVPGVRFVVVNQNGTVVGTRNGPGMLKITVPPNGFWDSVNKVEPPLGQLGTVEILAYAPHMQDTIEVDAPVSTAPITVTTPVPMRPMINPQGQNTPNEPNIVLGGMLHHLVVDGVSDYYSKYVHMTSSYLRTKP